MSKWDEVEPLHEKQDDVNYDESKIAPYTLEDPLTFVDGRKLTSPAEWPQRRREILDIFAKEMYGEEPPPPECLVTEMFDEKVGALAGFAIRRQYKMWFRQDKTGPCLNWIVFLPRYARKPVPVIMFLNYNGNAELVADADIPLMTSWCRNTGENKNTDHRMPPHIRGRLQNIENRTVFPVNMLIARGYAVMSCCYCEISPDPDPDYMETEPEFRQEVFAYTGVFSLWGQRDESRMDNTTTLGAWAWGLSRGLDLAERIDGIDASRPIVTGYSRLGKAAFLAAARDDRFKVCVPNQCGGGGVTLAKRDYGENIGTEMLMFKHWYCKAYGKYAKNPPRLLTFDQHLLLASIAPRRVLVQEYNAPWFDAKGSFLSCQAASPAWEFLGCPGLPKVDYPEAYDEQAIGSHLGFVWRTEEHGISAYDWTWLLDFADKAYKE
jgi:hypothetical protein